MGSGSPSVHRRTTRGSGQWVSVSATAALQGAVGSRCPAVYGVVCCGMLWCGVVWLCRVVSCHVVSGCFVFCCVVLRCIVLQVGQLFHYFVLVLLMGVYRTHVRRMVDTNTVPHHGSLTHLLRTKASTIAKLRRHLDDEGLVSIKRVLPAPSSHDFMEMPRTLSSQLMFLWFILPPYIVLLLVFTHGVEASRQVSTVFAQGPLSGK